MNEYSIKLHSFTTDHGFTPATGTVSCDFRGDKYVGREQGDEHHCIWEHKNPSDAEIAAVLAEGPALNQRMQSGNPLRILEELIDKLPEGNTIIDKLFGGLPNFRIGVWESHR